MVILFLKGFMVLITVFFGFYIVRHFIFTWNRLIGRQKVSYGDILDEDLPSVSVLVPMHNEEKVAENILKLLVNVDYPEDRLEIIPINDHSTDKTPEIIDDFACRYGFVKPIHRNNGKRGKPVALNDGLRKASGEIIMVFDADYLPPKNIIRELAVNFKDPSVGAVMGRVIPVNPDKNLLTRLIDLERTGGYQVDQQARYNLGLIPQYGGTVGGFRKTPVLETGGFDENILAEDTELTFRLYLMGYRVVYTNRVECWEEVPEDWEVRGKQVRRWSRGHNQVLFKYFTKLLKSRNLSILQKLDGALLLMVYALPVVLLAGWVDALLLFFAGETNILVYSYVWLATGIFSGFGNFAPFYQIGVGAFLDGLYKRVALLPFLFFNFFFNTFYITYGFIEAVAGILGNREIKWHKTERYRG
ncbi:glycosyltransferase [Persephonella sp.]